MAEILVLAVDQTSTDQTVDARAPKRGDIISVQADGWQWGTEEVKPPAQGGLFFRILIPGADPEALKQYCAIYHDGIQLVKTRLNRFVTGDFTGPVATQIANTGSVTLTLTQAKKWIENKQTLARAG